MVSLTYTSVEQTQTFVTEGVAIILEHGLDGWEQVKEQLERHRMNAGLDGPREATVAGWEIVRAFMLLDGEDRAAAANINSFCERFGVEAYQDLKARMKPYGQSSFFKAEEPVVAEEALKPNKLEVLPSGAKGHPRASEVTAFFFVGHVMNKQGKEWPAVITPGSLDEDGPALSRLTISTLSPSSADFYGKALQMLAEMTRKTREE